MAKAAVDADMPADGAEKVPPAAGGFPPHLLSEILENIIAGVCVWDRDLRLVTWNSSYRKVNCIPDGVLRVGIRLAEVLDNSAPLLDDHRTGEELEALTRRMLKEKGRLDLDRKLADGHIISVNFHAFSDGRWLAIYRDVTERRQAVRRLDASINAMPYGFSIWDERRRLALWNKRYLDIYQMPAGKLRKGMTLAELVDVAMATGHDPDRSVSEVHEHYRRLFDETATPDAVSSYERIVHGRVIHSTYTRTAGVGWVVTHEDVTDHKAQLERAAEREAELQKQNMRFDAAINNMPVSLAMFDADQRLVICNRNYARIYDLPPELVEPGTLLADIIRYRRSHGTHPVRQPDYFERRIEIVRAGKEDISTIELEDGRTIMVRHQPMADGGWVSTQEDITEQRQSEARISHLARHDPLTDLPNRSYFREQMELAEARIRRGETIAVLCVDLDHFKGVNDTLGHSLGDAVLEKVAERLKASVREVDVVGRLGGDEFAVLQGALASPEDAAILARRIVEAIAEPFDVQGHHILIGASIGIAVAPADGRDTDTLMRNADLALYRAKGEGRGACRYFEPGMDAAIQERRAIEVGLRLALARSELRLVYQPLISLDRNRITGLEALLRWDHPERGTVAPEDFVPVAEETGLIVPIGEWVLREACKAAASWPEEITIAVNLSPVQFKNRNLIEHVTDAIAAAGIAPSRLEIEVTESLLLSDADLTIKILHQLRKLGVRISMDDFGTGYSALGHLRSFPFDKIKIDRSFVRDLAAKGDSLAIVKAVIGLGRSLGIATTAEGVETETQLDMVRQQGCSEVQGFLFSPPLPAAAVSRLFAASPAAAVLDPVRKNAS